VISQVINALYDVNVKQYGACSDAELDRLEVHPCLIAVLSLNFLPMGEFK